MEASPVTHSETAGLFTMGLKKKVLFVPTDIIPSLGVSEGPAENPGAPFFQLTLNKLPHPRTGDICSWVVNEANGRIYQLFQLEKCQSLFVGNYVLEDGTIKCLVPLDPLFVVLPYLLLAKKRKRFQPLSQILVDNQSTSEECTKTLQLLASSATIYLRDLDLICSKKTFQEEDFYKLSKSKLKTWMKLKTKVLAECLEREKINVSSKVAVAGLLRKEEGQTKDQYERYAFGMLSDLLPDSLHDEIAAFLGFGSQSDTQSEAANSAKKHKGESVEAVEDYSKSFKSVAPVAEKKLTNAQKQLLKVDKTGMKSISSYFTPRGTTDKGKK